MDERAYVVAVKRSARRRSAAAGEWVRNHGPRRTFRSKYAARRWAARVSEPGRRVWVQDANPRDDSGVDGYLVGGRRVTGDGADGDAERHDGRTELSAFAGP